MKNLLKYGVFIILTLTFGAFIFAQPHTQAAFFGENASVVETPENDVVKTEIKVSDSPIFEKTDVFNLIKSDKSLGSDKTISNGMAFRATCYCLRGRTASGAMVRRGIVAADPRILPLGTRVSLSNAGKYSGTYLVADTGGVIKGRILDIWVPSCGEAITWGRKSVTVSVIGRGGKSPSKSVKKAKKVKA